MGWGGADDGEERTPKNLIPILEKSLKKSGFLKLNLKSQILNLKPKLQKINKTLEREPKLLEQFLKFIPTIETPKIDAIAVTVGPGLEPALWVGINFAKALAKVWKKADCSGESYGRTCRRKQTRDKIKSKIPPQR